jgi:hypothetical protein
VAAPGDDGIDKDDGDVDDAPGAGNVVAAGTSVVAAPCAGGIGEDGGDEVAVAAPGEGVSSGTAASSRIGAAAVAVPSGTAGDDEASARRTGRPVRGRRGGAAGRASWSGGSAGLGVHSDETC